MAREYATKLTKEDLIKAGIKDIYFDPIEQRYHIISNDGKEVKLYYKNGYLSFALYKLDENGNKIKVPVKQKYKYRGNIKEKYGYNYKSRPMTLSRALWAWFKGEASEGLVVDHIDNKHTTHYDNRLDNLQLITQQENSLKNRPQGSRNGTSDLPCAMTKPIQYYIDKYNYWLMEYEREKKEKGSQTSYAGACRYTCSVFKKKIRYWYRHKNEWEEYNRLETAKLKAFQYQQDRRSKIKQLKQEIKQAKKISKELWHQKVEEYNTFLENVPYQTQEALEKMFLEQVIQ